MKKISNPTGEILIEEAASTFNGISFHIFKRIGPFFGVGREEFFTSINESGEIYTREGSAAEEYWEVSKGQDKYKVIGTILSYLIIAVLILRITPGQRRIEMSTGLALLGIGILMMGDMVPIFILSVFGKKNYQALRRYHGAEHAVINAYYDLGRVPTIEEIKAYSNWSYNCGSLIKIRRALPYLTVGLGRILSPGFWYLLTVIFIVILAIWLSKSNRIVFMEALVTSQPTETEYAVAITGLENSLKMLEEINIVEAEELDMVEMNAEAFEQIVFGVRMAIEGRPLCDECPLRDSCDHREDNPKNCQE